MINRRTLLGGLAAAAGAGLVAGCDTGVSTPGASNVLRWWDHTPNLQDANKVIFDEYEKAGGRKVEYSYHQTAKMGQALQLARQSEQLPDVFTNVGLQIPLPQLISDGWFQPMQLSDEAKEAIGKDSLVSGIHEFEGEIYSFPIANPRQYWAPAWFNTELITKAGLDPANPPRTYDEFREALRKVMASTEGAFGVVLNVGMLERMANQVNHMAAAAGFEGHGGMLYKTGEYGFNTEPYHQVIEFLMSLNKDKLIMPGAVQLDDKTGRQRWATGVAGYFLDGPWCPGVVSKDAPPFLDKVDVGPMLVPEAGVEPVCYQPPQGGMFFTSGSSSIPEESGKIFSLMALPEYQKMIAKGMAQPPLDMSVVADSEAHPSYKKLITWYQKDCFVGPVPVVRNPAVGAVNAAATKVKPDLGAIIQGLFSGDVPDARKALATLNDASEKAREQAMAKVKGKGKKVSMDDFAFENWKPRQDFTADMYP